MDELDPTSRVLLDPLQQRNRTIQVFCGTWCSSSHAFWPPCTSQCWTGCTDSAWTWQTPGGKTRHRIDYIALLDAWNHLQIHACNHPACDISMGSIDHVVTSTRIMLPAVCDAQANVRRRPVAVCRDLLDDPVACSVFRDLIAELLVVPWTTDPHTHAELLSRGIISCAKKAFLFNTKPRKDSVSSVSWNIITSRKQARTTVLGAPHHLRCAALSLTFAAWARRFSVVNAVAAEVRDLHMRRAFALVILSKTSSRLRASLRNDRKQWRLQVQHQIQFDVAAGFSKGVFRGTARLVKKPMASTPKLQLEDGSRISDERQATERWLRFASERHGGQPTSATALLETICAGPFFCCCYGTTGVDMPIAP